MLQISLYSVNVETLAVYCCRQCCHMVAHWLITSAKEDM